MDLKSFCEHLNQRFEQLKRIRSRKERCFLERQIQQFVLDHADNPEIRENFRDFIVDPFLVAWWARKYGDVELMRERIVTSNGAFQWYDRFPEQAELMLDLIINDVCLAWMTKMEFFWVENDLYTIPDDWLEIEIRGFQDTEILFNRAVQIPRLRKYLLQILSKVAPPSEVEDFYNWMMCDFVRELYFSKGRHEYCSLYRPIDNETRIRCDGCCKKECALHDIRAEQIRQHLIQDRGYPQRRANFLVGRWRETGRCYAPD